MLLAVGSLLLVVLIGQLGLAVYVSIDAKRRQLEQPGQYAAGVSIPFLGLLLFGVYRSYRDEFSRREPLESEQAAGHQRVESKRDPSAGPAELPPPDHWTVRVSGLAGTPRRFAYSVAGLGRLSWGAIVGVPTALLVATVAIDSRVAIVYFGACAGLWLVLLAALAQFTDTAFQSRRGAPGCGPEPPRSHSELSRV